MFLIIISIILMIITMVALCLSLSDDNYHIIFKFKPRMFLGMFWLLLIVFGCFKVIPANTVGVLYNPLSNGVQDSLLQEGLKGKTPFETVYLLSTEVTELTFENISIQTVDSQWVKTKIQVQLQIDKTKAFDYFRKYKDKSFADISNILVSTTQKEFEKVSTKYNVMAVLGESRTDIVNEVYASLKEEFYKDGIVLLRVVLVDTDAGDVIEASIAKEASAKKEAETAKYLKEKAELEGQALVIEAQKQKEANDLLSKSLTKEILMEQYISKWNGELPKVTSDGNLFDVSSLLGE